MTQAMKSYEEVQELAADCPSKTGMINIWTCTKCRKQIFAVHQDTGVTPFMLICECGETAHSAFYRIPQPAILWFRPRSLEELTEITKQELAAAKVDVSFEQALQWNIDHYNSGGLFRKKIK